jgi:hypothetical protein
MTQPPHADLAVQPGQSQSSGDSDAIDAPPAADFIDAPPPAAESQWPPLGAFPGEPGHLEFDDARPTVAIPAYRESFADQTQVLDTGWPPPRPAEPWHAQHERDGEWQTRPPEHLAFKHSIPSAAIPPGSPDQPTQAAHSTSDTPLLPMEHEAPPRRRAGLWVALALVVTLLLCGGGATSAYLLLRNADSGTGAPDPATAVNRFLTAVYTQQDATAANALVCRNARDQKKLTARVAQIKDYSAQYDGPSFRWTDPAVASQDQESATVAVQLTMSTEDEKQAQQELTFTVIHKTGWLVCDITG